MRFRLLIISLTAALMAACSGNDAQRNAEEMLKQAKFDFEHGRYEMALEAIDSLRKIYPNAVEARRKALALYQNISLKQAQEDLEQTDKLLQEAKREYDIMKREVDKRRAELRATPEELQAVTLMKMEMDSLQVRFDVQCAKIRYIHKQQKGDTGLPATDRAH